MAVLAHCPAFGVKVYVVVAKLFKAGDHEPEIPLLETTGKAAKLPPEQIGETDENVGSIGVQEIVYVFGSD